MTKRNSSGLRNAGTIATVAALTLGMGMTEKQGGSDVRTNTTRAYPLTAGGPGAASSAFAPGMDDRTVAIWPVSAATASRK